MKELLERLLVENKEMMDEISKIYPGDYKTGYVQALLNVKSRLEFQLNELTLN